MRKYITLPLVFLLVLSCAKKENPLSVDHTAANLEEVGTALPAVVETYPANKGEITDENDDVSGIQARIKIVFSDYMDETTINSTNVLFYNVMENKYEDVDMEYDAARKTLYLSKAEFQDNCAFVLILKPGITNLAGNPLDGNGNGKEDGDPYDRAVFYFYTGNGDDVVDGARTAPPYIASVIPDTSGNVPVNAYFEVTFANGPIDTSTISTSCFHLEKTSTGTAVTLEIDTVTFDMVRLVISGGDTLDRGERYTFTIDAGKIKALPDSLYERGCTLTAYLMDLDMDGDGLEPEEENVVIYFVTEGISYPHVISGTSRDYGDYFYFKFDKKMDASTFTQENIRVFDDFGYVPGTMIIDLDSMGVKYYYDRDVSGTVEGWVAMEVMDTEGHMLDGNGNGIGGEEGKDDWSSLSGTGGTIFFDNMESGSGGWTTGGSNCEWERGIPTFGPSSAYSGQRCYGTDLDAPYDYNSDGYLVSKDIDLTGYPRAYLEFWHWFDIYGDSPPWSLDSGGWVEISIDGGATWIPIYPDSGQLYNETLDADAPWSYGNCLGQTSGGWVYSRFNLTSYVGNVVKIRFYFWADSSVDPGTYAGWYIDDVRVWW